MRVRVRVRFRVRVSDAAAEDLKVRLAAQLLSPAGSSSLGRGGGGDAGRRLCSARARAASQVAGEVQLSLQRVEDELQVQRAD